MIEGMRPSLHSQRAIDAYRESTGAKSLAARVVLAAILGTILLGFMFATGCCVSKSEFAGLTGASRSYFDKSAPVLRESIAKDASLDEQSRKTRLAFVDDYEAVLKAAEERRDGKESPK